MKKYLFFFILLFSHSQLLSQLYFNEISSSLDFNHSYFQGVSGAGVTFVDFDQDGLDDITIPTNGNNSILFLRNNGEKLIPLSLDSEFPTQIKQVLWIDYDNDYDKDLYVSSFNGKNKLYNNNGFLDFEDVTNSVNLPDSISNSFGSSWSDINNDGYLDLLQTYRSGDSISNTVSLFLNDRGLSFIDITNLSSISEINKLPFCATFIDIDNDNVQDLYIANDKSSGNSLYYNNFDSTFSNISIQSSTDIKMDAMSVTVGDFNNDSFFDIYSTNLEEGNKLFVNNQDLSFTERAADLSVSFNAEGWGSQFEDFDMDGYEDLYVSGSLVGSNVNSSAFYSNIFGKYFEKNISVGLGVDTVSSYGNAVGDINNDGYPDIVVLNMEPFNSFLFKNNYSGNNNWLKVNLIGFNSNRDAFGARVVLHVDDKSMSRGKFSSEGYLSQNSNSLFFGLGSSSLVDSLEVYWPSGEIDILYQIEGNKLITINEGSTSIIPKIYSFTNSFCDGSSLTLETGYYNQYLWSTGDTTQNINVSQGGNYFVNVYNELGTMFSSDTITIENIPPPNFDIIVKDITNQHTSSIQINNINSSNDYYLSLDGGNYYKNKFFFPNLSSGEHSITVRDKRGCETTKSFEIKNLVKDSGNSEFTNQSIARKWIEVLLQAIRDDLARPPIHARNLFHISSLMYDALVIKEKLIHDKNLTPFLLGSTINETEFPFEFPNYVEDEEYIEKIISYASYNFIRHRFQKSVGVINTFNSADSLMLTLDYDINYDKLDYLSGDPRSIGNYLYKIYSDYGFIDNSNELNDYSSNYYSPLNPPLDLDYYGNPNIIDPNRWQPLKISNFIDQSGNLIEGIPKFISPEWGNVIPFALKEEDLVIKLRDDNVYKIYHDPGPPPLLDTLNQGTLDSLFKSSFSMVSIWGSHLDRSDGVLLDISPNSIGNLNSYPSDFFDFHNLYKYFDGGDVGLGHNINPFNNLKYEEQIVPRGDYTRVLAEFWADGPDSETPPGHWFVILNEVNDDKNLIRKFQGIGDELDRLEWDIKSYFLMGGAMHDAAISAWGSKGYYDYARPISIIRYLSENGQSTHEDSANYNPNGFPLIEGYIELVSLDDPLVGEDSKNLGKVKLFTWKGFSESDSSDIEKGVGWILAEEWWPYQRPSFVTPPFAGYISGHSTYSSAAATILEKLTGSEYFPGGIGEFNIPKNNFLVFEKGPSVDMKLQWATYRDAADQCALSRIWGGIHPYVDDIPGRKIGKNIGDDAFSKGKLLFEDRSLITGNEYKEYKFSVFPNPLYNNKNLTILNETSKNIDKIKLINLSGEIILSKNVNDNHKKIILNINNLQKGIHLLMVHFEDGSVKSTKIVFK